MNNIPPESVLLRSPVPFVIMVVLIAFTTYLLAYVAQDWYNFRRSGTVMTRGAWCYSKIRLCKEVWKKFVVAISLRKLPGQSWKLKPTRRRY
jgi:hypothetical protein